MNDQIVIKGAKEQFEKVLEISHDYSWAYYNLAVIFYEEEDYDNAIENLNKTIQFNPIDIEAYKILAKILCKTGLYEQALNIAEEALSKCGENGDLYYIAAQIYKEIQNPQEYEHNLNLAIKNHKTLSIPIKKVQDEIKNL